MLVRARRPAWLAFSGARRGQAVWVRRRCCVNACVGSRAQWCPRVRPAPASHAGRLGVMHFYVSGSMPAKYKVCRMPARAGVPTVSRSPKKGGRRTSLGGGNRGECLCRVRLLQDYGDWMRSSATGTSNGGPHCGRTRFRSTKRWVRSRIRWCECGACRALLHRVATPIPANCAGYTAD